MENKIIINHVVGGIMTYGGTESFIINHFRLIDKSKFKTNFIILESGKSVYDNEIKRLRGTIYCIPSRRASNSWTHLRHFIKICDSYDRSNVIFHLHLDGLNGLYSLILRILGFNKVVSHSHNTNFLTQSKFKLFYHLISKFSIRFFATNYSSCGYDAAEWMYGKKIAKNKVVTIPNAINFKRFEYSTLFRREIRYKYNVRGKYVIGHVGRFHEQKNQKFIVMLAEQLKLLNLDFIIILIGDGDDKLFIINNIKDLRLENHFVFIDSNEEIYKFYSSFDLFILPSLFEGLPLVLIEAQVNGLDIIASKTVSIESKMSENFIYLDIQKMDEWIESIYSRIKIVNSRNSNFELSEKLQQYNIVNSIKKLEEFYMEIFNEKNSLLF